MSEPVYEVVWPLGKSVYETLPLAPRSDDLSGKTVCELWDWLFRGEEIFPILREALARRYSGIKFADYNIFGNTHSAREKAIISELPRLLRERQCDAVISAVGA
ncbi:MAG: hypothetical protein HYX92_07860 [Chloroflexi bacterium]|nr:hypothetical protein [Chloroflexota bacterium]